MGGFAPDCQRDGGRTILAHDIGMSANLKLLFFNEPAQRARAERDQKSATSTHGVPLRAILA